MARECFKEALMIDVKCYDALEHLVKYNMMEEKAGKKRKDPNVDTHTYIYI
jgi:hypothetical protein